MTSVRHFQPALADRYHSCACIGNITIGILST
jgi:hypothetical protein